MRCHLGASIRRTPLRTVCSMGVQLGPETAPWSSVSARAPSNSCPVDLQGRSAGPHDGKREPRFAGRERSRRWGHYFNAFRIKPEGYTVAAGARETRAPQEQARPAARSTTSKALPRTRLAAIARWSKLTLARAAPAAAAHPMAAPAVALAALPREAATLAQPAAPRSRPPAPSTPLARSLAAAPGIWLRRVRFPPPRAPSLGAAAAPPAPPPPPRTASRTSRRAAASTAAMGSGSPPKKKRRHSLSTKIASWASAQASPPTPWPGKQGSGASRSTMDASVAQGPAR